MIKINTLLDSMPIVVAKQKRSSSARVAKDICKKGDCELKNRYYYGVKLHVLGQSQYRKLPVPRQMLLSKASRNDLKVAKDLLSDIHGIEVFSDNPKHHFKRISR